jgi:hypothetical protein
VHESDCYGQQPLHIGQFDFDLPEVMHYLYLPVRIDGHAGIRLPQRLERCRCLIDAALHSCSHKYYKYVYLSARKGWATRDNPLNRPGWHCDGFGTCDLNFVWWRGPSTRFAIQEFKRIVPGHLRSLTQFDEQVRRDAIVTYPEKGLYQINPFVVHATPDISVPCWRQYVKISASDNLFNLENNSYNYLFSYNWPLHPRAGLRNDPHRAEADYVAKDSDE